MVTSDFTGKVAFVTGGSAGLGAATVRAFAEAGAAVAIVDLNADAAGAAAIARWPRAVRRCAPRAVPATLPGTGDRRPRGVADAASGGTSSRRCAAR